MRKRCLLFALVSAIVFARGIASAIDISVTGNLTRTIDTSDLQSGAGSNLISIYESVSDHGLMTLSNTTGNADNWRVDVRRSDTTWNGNLVLFVKRTGDGSGGGSISGGSGYQQITALDSQFFSGSGDRTNIPIQLKLSGVSITIPPNTFSTTVIYTVVDN